MSDYRQALLFELKCQEAAATVQTDILLVVHNQPEHTRNCIQSDRVNTNNYRLFIWDNASSDETRQLLDCNVLKRSEENLGFILPNNELARLTTAPYIILINSDVVVSSGWAEAMIGFLQSNPEYAVVGYEGGLLDENFQGCKSVWGDQIDYVCGWCMCIDRKVYEEIGLFDTNLTFAYGEDSDFCLRVKNLGRKIYALHLRYACHVGNATIRSLADQSATFRQNHEYLKSKHYFINRSQT